MFLRRISKTLRILRAEVFWSLLLNHYRVTQAQIRQNGGLSPSAVWMSTRYLRTFMGRSLTHQVRRDIVILQAEQLRGSVNRCFFLELEQPRQALWRSEEEPCCSIWLSADLGRHLEGDFELAFKLDGVAIYTLSFSIGPNLANPAPGDVAMLVGRVQGKRGRFDDIRLATKALKGVSPPALLVSAAEGIALALNLSHICGVAASEQLSCSNQGAEYFDYDGFWESLSGRRIGGWYRFDAPFPHKPSSQTATHHRRRARQRRLFRDTVREEVRAAFVERFARQSPRSIPRLDRLPSRARWMDHWVLPSTGIIAGLALTTFYWIWPGDLIPDRTRYGRADDLAVVFAWAILSFRVVTTWRSRHAARSGEPG